MKFYVYFLLSFFLFFYKSSFTADEGHRHLSGICSPKATGKTPFFLKEVEKERPKSAGNNNGENKVCEFFLEKKKIRYLASVIQKAYLLL
jgi:hypothetical protein